MKNLQPNEFAPYYENYIKLVPEQDIVKGLLKQKEEMLHFFKSIPVFKHEYRYAEGKWTVKDIILHLIDAERIFAYRALRIARGDETALAGFDENEYADAAKTHHRTLKDLVHEFQSVRAATLSLFQSLGEEELSRLGTANGAAVSPNAIGYIIIGHAQHHEACALEGMTRQMGARFDAGQQERKSRSGQHHARGHAQHGVFVLGFEALQKNSRQSPECGGGQPRAAAPQGPTHHIFLGGLDQPNLALQQQDQHAHQCNTQTQQHARALASVLGHQLGPGHGVRKSGHGYFAH